MFVHSARNLKDIKNSHSNVTDLSQHTDTAILYQLAAFLLLYFAAGLAYFSSPGVVVRGDKKDVTVIDAIYFVVVSITTTGYGDLKPVAWHARVITCLFVLVGLGVCSLGGGVFANHLLNSQRRQTKGTFEEEMSREMARVKKV